jgi:hypothetical protein
MKPFMFVSLPCLIEWRAAPRPAAVAGRPERRPADADFSATSGPWSSCTRNRQGLPASGCRSRTRPAGPPVTRLDLGQLVFAIQRGRR